MIEKEANFTTSSNRFNTPESSSARSSLSSPSTSGARTLNRNLFGEGASAGKVVEGISPSHLPHLLQTEQKIQEVKGQLSTLAEHFGSWTENYAEFAKSCQLKFERVHQALQKLENNDQVIANEAGQKFNRVNERFAERKSVDSKVQEMIDRHNSVIKSFEMRLSQMQKLMADKEALLISMQAALNESKMELARLKRM